tara:strand:+ start:11066 stop:12223 length:1158 start_codon:yes stop_codon:yes gene_type:complete
MTSFKNLEDFETLFFKKMRGLSENDGATKERIKKFYELIILKDKASPEAPTNKKTLRRISIVLTTFCNLKCVWCHREEKHVKDAGYLSKNMNFDLLMNLLPQLKGFEVLTWGGLGEPMLYKHFYEVTKEARKYFKIVKTTCNGTTLNERNIFKLRDSGLNFLEVSIDGFDNEANMKLRGAHEDKIIKSLEFLSANTDIPLQINTVVSQENYDSLLGAIEKLKNVKNIIMMHTIPLFMTKHMQELGIEALDIAKYKRLLSKWDEDIKKNNLKWELSPNIKQVEYDPVSFMKQKHNICFSPYEDPTINIDGEIVPCSRLQHLGIGNVFKEGFDEVWNGEKMKKFRGEQLEGNYGNLCQRECSMKVTSRKSDQEREKALKTIHRDINI